MSCSVMRYHFNGPTFNPFLMATRRRLRSWTRRHRLRSWKRRHRLPHHRWILLLQVLSLVAAILHIWNQSFVLQWAEAPLDHLTSSLWKPLYHAMGCPQMNHDDSPKRTVPFYMMSARPKHLVDPVLATYDGYFNATLYNTTNLSRDYHNDKCNRPSFKSRLFGIYQIFLSTVIDDYVVTVEDDVILLDGEQFQREINIAISHDYAYYSFTKNSNSETCLYQFGTTAQLWSRRFIEQLLNVSKDAFCRLPIDMYVAQQGPWYVTQHRLVQHVGTERLTHVSSGVKAMG